MHFSSFRRVATGLLLLGGLVTPLRGQNTATPRACLAAVLDSERDQIGRRAQTGLSYARITANKISQAKRCAAAAAAATTSSELPALARLQLIAGDTASANSTIQTYLATPGATDSARADQYVTAVPLLISTRLSRSFTNAAQIAERLDGMSTAVTPAKIAVRGSLLTYYRAIDVDSQIEVHARRVIALAPALDPAQRASAAHTLLQAYTTLSEVYGNRAHADSAVELLARGLTDLADLPEAAGPLTAERARYALVGTAATPIVAAHWLNAPGRTTSYDPKGNITVLQFTAHWCPPCRRSYPAMRRLQRAHASHGVKTVFVTNLYGFFHDREKVTAKQELDADRKYFLREHALPGIVAISPLPDDQNSTSDLNNEHYKVGGIPHIVVIDRRGIIRMIVIGWDPASEARINTMLNTLSGEKIGRR